MTVTGPRGTTIAADYPAGVRGVAMTRRDLDAILLDGAIEAGGGFGAVGGKRQAAFVGFHARAPILMAGSIPGSRPGDMVRP
jgi:hypothetical protein